MIIFFIVSGFSFLSQAVYLPGVNTSGRSLHPSLIPVSPLLPGLGQGVSPDSSVPNNRDCSFSGGGTGTRYIVWWRPLICPALCPAPHFHTLSHFVFASPLLVCQVDRKAQGSCSGPRNKADVTIRRTETSLGLGSAWL